MSRWICSAAAAVAFPFFAVAFAPGENILANGLLKPDGDGCLPEWNLPKSPRIGTDTFLSASGGPKGAPSLRFAWTPASAGDFALRQFDITLSTAGVYRLSAKVRTKGFRYGSAGFVVIDGGWQQSYGVKDFPETSGWSLVESRVKLKPSSDGVYSVALFANGVTSGEIEIADIRLEALDEAAAKGACLSGVVRSLEKVRIVPWMRLCDVPASNREVTFRCFGKMPAAGRHGDWCVKVSASDVPGVEVNGAVRDGFAAAVLPPGASKGFLKVRLSSMDGATNLVTETFPYRVIQDDLAENRGRRLNNLVRELVSETFEGDFARTFAMPRDGWVFISVEPSGGDSSGDIAATLDGRRVTGTACGGNETFRRVEAGRHRVAVSGAGRIVVRSVPEIFNYCPCRDNPVGRNPSYGWDFAERYVLPASTTQNGGDIPLDKVPLLHARGGEWAANFISGKINDSRILYRRLMDSNGLTDPFHDGVSCDEQAFNRMRHLEMFTQGLKAFNAEYRGNRTVYTWVIGHTPPMHHGLAEEFMATAAAASCGRGRILLEHYCRTQPDESAARTHLDRFIADMFRRCCEWYPPFRESAGVILGVFDHVPIMSLRSHPEVDYKRYLDMQFNLLANDPTFEGLPCTGVWGPQRADEELYRWTFRLLRHYCVEGRTDMLSDAYRFAYIPGHLRNGDFRGSLDPWTATGDVSLETVKEFGAKCEGRWKCARGLGDTFAVLKRGNDGSAATLRQTAVGLEVGRMYCLETAAFDAKDLRKGTFDSCKVPLAVTLSDGAAICKDLSWTHEDRRRGKKVRGNTHHISRHHIVFTAKAQQVDVILSVSEAPPGSEMGVNFVGLTPYFPESNRKATGCGN